MAEKDIEIKLRATGGKQAAKEVQEVNQAIEEVSQTAEGAAEAVEQLNIATEKAAQQDPARKLVPAWDEVAESTDEATEAAGDAVDGLDQLNRASGELQGMFDGLRDKLEDARQELHEMRNAAESGGTGLGSMANRAVALVGRLTVVATAIKSIVSEINKIERAGAASMEAFADSTEQAASAMERADILLEQLSRSIDQTLSPARTLSGELGNFAAAQEATNNALTKGIRDAAEAATAYDNLSKAVLDLKVAQGELTAEEAAKQRGAIDIEAIRREAKLRVDEARIAADTAKRISEGSRQVAEEARAQLEEAQRVAEEAGRVPRERLRRGLDRAAGAATIGNLSPTDPGAASAAIAAAGGEDEVRRLIAEMTGKEGFFARWRLMLGASVESVLGAAERANLAEMLQAEADAEIEAASKQLDAATKEAREFAEAKRREFERIKQQSEEADRAARAAESALSDAERRQALTEQTAVPAAERRTEAEQIRLERQRQEREAREAERRRREAEREAMEAERRRIAEEKARLDAEAKARAGEFSDRARRGEAAGLSEGAKWLEQTARGLADGISMGELERALFSVGRVLEETPERTRSQMQQLVAPLQRSLEEWRRRMDTLESQVRNNPNRG